MQKSSEMYYSLCKFIESRNSEIYRIVQQYDLDEQWAFKQKLHSIW